MFHWIFFHIWWAIYAAWRQLFPPMNSFPNGSRTFTCDMLFHPMTGHPTWTNESNLNVILSYESVLHSQTDTNKSCLTIKLTVIVLILVYLWNVLFSWSEFCHGTGLRKKGTKTVPLWCHCYKCYPFFHKGTLFSLTLEVLEILEKKWCTLTLVTQC